MRIGLHAVRALQSLLLVLLASCAKRDHVSELGNLTPVRIVTLSGDSLSFRRVLPARSSQGDFIALVEGRNGLQLLVVDTAGKRRMLPLQSGAGPGEIQDPQAMGFGSGDALWINDGGTRLNAYVTTPRFTYVRTLRISPPAFSQIGPHGLLTAAMRRGDSLTPPQRIDFTGTVERLGHADIFVADSQLVIPALAPDGSVWVASPMRYQVEHRDGHGTVLGSIGRSVEWFPPHAGQAGLPWVERPRPQIIGLASVDNATVNGSTLSTIVVLIRTAAENWRPQQVGAQRKSGPVTRSLLGRLDTDSLFAYRVEMLDGTTGRVVASASVTGLPLGFLANGHLVCWSTDANGTEMLAVYGDPRGDVNRYR